MRRVARRLFTLCTAASLLLCAAACVMWVRSYGVGEGGKWWSARGGAGVSYHEIRSGNGRLLYKYAWEQGAPGPPAGTPRFRRTRWEPSPPADDVPDPEALAWAGFHWQQGDAVYGGPFTLVGVPYWFLMAAAGALPMTWLVVRARARHRLNAGHCTTCGYDLRASPARCPECGGAAAVSPA